MDPLSQRFHTERQRRGLSIRELAATTKIREPYIEALERGRYDVLPAVYVRSFIRTLGAALGIPASELASLMASTFDEQHDLGERLPAYQPTPPPKDPSVSFSQAAQRTSDAVAASVERVRAATQQPIEQIQKVSSRIPRRALIAGGVVVLLIVLWLLIRMFDSSSTTTSPEDVILVEDSTSLAPTDSIILTAVAQDTAWVSITMDGTRSQQVVVLPETDYRWSAMEKFVVSIQNAGAVQFFRNEMPLPVFGKAGEAVREVRITRKDVTASNTAYKPPKQQAPPAPKPAPAKAAPSKPAPNKVSASRNPTAARVATPQRERRQAARPQRKVVQQKRKQAPVQRRRAIEQPIITPAPRQPIRR